MTYLLLQDYERRVECQYKGETYSVRDNGAVLLHPQNSDKPRPSDNKWTFGKYDDKTGYAKIAGESVHRIVATAFHGEPPSSQYVVDHIDTNRRNNRPENLRWVTKLENILLNPITVKKIEWACGSIEEFLKDPSKLRKKDVDSGFEWMRAVTKEEALASLERMQSWAKSDSPSSNVSIGEWIYKRSMPKEMKESEKISSEAVVESSKAEKSRQTLSENKIQEKKKEIKSKSNPFDFPRLGDSEDKIPMYRTNGELLGLIKTQLESNKTIKLPSLILPTAGRGIVIKESWTIEFEEVDFCYEGKSKIPKSFILHSDNQLIAVLVRRDKNKNEEEIDKLKRKDCNIIEIDLSWAKDGVTEDELKYLIQTDITMKKWLHHKQILEVREKVEEICEPITSAGEGVLHSYFACPLTSKGVEDIECWYCDYRLNKENSECNYCFGKSGVKTYEDLLSIVRVDKKDGKIVCITYSKDGEEIVKQFDTDSEERGKTLFQLWDERTSEEIIVHNIYSDWYVLISRDPKLCLEQNGEVHGKLGRNAYKLRDYPDRPIFNADNSCWEFVKN